MGLYDSRMRNLLTAHLGRLLEAEELSATVLRNSRQDGSTARITHQIVFSEIYYHIAAAKGQKVSSHELVERLECNSVLPLAVRAAVLAQVRQGITEAAQAPVSHFQLSVVSSLKRIGCKPSVEHITPDGFHSVDIALCTSGPGRAARIAIEVDGPTHFSMTPPYRMLGDTIARRRVLAALGWVVISVPFYDWYELDRKEDQDAWMRQALADAHCAN
jgi:RAP domain